MKKIQRPLSPHLQIYKPQLTSVLSITHRLTSLGLVVMACLIVMWLGSAAISFQLFNLFMKLAHHAVGKTIAFFGIMAFFYHLLNGIRHLLWDRGWGLELKQVYRSGWMVAGLTVGLSLMYWW